MSEQVIISAVENLTPLARPDVLGPLLATATGEAAWRTPRVELITGGKSNLTFRLLSEAGELILRRPPSGTVAATAHDMSRETTVQRALASTPVPVPEVVLEDEGAAAGFPFYVMTKVPGVVIRDQAPAGLADTPDQRHSLGLALVDVLADLHSVDPAAVGLAEFGRPGGFAARQVRRWRSQLENASTPPGPAVRALAERLAASVPADPRPAIVHGDFRLDNCLVDGPGHVSGVLDWEMSTLGDPLTDLGMLLFYWEPVSRLAPVLVSSLTAAPGFPTMDDVANRWSGRTGIGLQDLDWYLAFAHFKFAGIAQNIHDRVRAGAMAGQDFGDLTGVVNDLAEGGLAIG